MRRHGGGNKRIGLGRVSYDAGLALERAGFQILDP